MSPVSPAVIPPCILVTGANRGIGVAIVGRCLLQSKEMHIVLAFSELRKADAKFQKLTAIVNNAGIAYGSTANILNVNTLGPKRIDDDFLPFLDMAAPGKPRIVQISSGAAPRCVQSSSAKRRSFFMETPNVTWEKISAVVDEVNQGSGAKGGDLTKGELKKQFGIGSLKGPGSSAYSLSKALLNLYTSWRTKECGDNVRVNAFSPGAIATDLFSESAFACIMRKIMKSPDSGTKSTLLLLF
ncbi:hypothetical protein TL16_g07039 [Triparma laevis f. inornata]|uniref:NAD(P)-binding protein n=2 Tax=Triparma laevis TaxID=1534972 RepID=A0A9W7E0X5_9STRA|nr:hypothetical protein TrLO_g8086 [Triparma laevis f. longispina]GMH76327.1 hypothetical protein TL16_g07039 [Triparma laevis f. inornata]